MKPKVFVKTHASHHEAVAITVAMDHDAPILSAGMFFPRQSLAHQTCSPGFPFWLCRMAPLYIRRTIDRTRILLPRVERHLTPGSTQHTYYAACHIS